MNLETEKNLQKNKALGRESKKKENKPSSIYSMELAFHFRLEAYIHF